MKTRIWELDAFRGFCILAVIVLHLLFDLSYFGGFFSLDGPVLVWIMQYGGVLFVLLSGLCATLGSRSFRRGLVVFGCGLLITLVTVGMVWLNMAELSLIIWFGVLHLLGVCMMVWPLFRRLPVWALAVLGLGFVGLGFWFRTLRVETFWLVSLGLRPVSFASSDYFPLFPHLGWFLLGAVLGRTVYREKQTRLPKFPSRVWPVRALQWCGRHSLWIYLVHQPVIFGITWVLTQTLG